MTQPVLRRLLPLLTVALLLAAVVPGPALAADPATGVRSSSGRELPPLPPGVDAGPSIQAQMLAEHAADAERFAPGAPPSVPLRSATGAADGGAYTATSLPNGLRKEVFGFLPYWMVNASALDDLNYQLLSTIAYFSVGANKDGNLQKGSASAPSTGWAGWQSSLMTGVIDRAHASGVRVVLTVTMMAWDSTSASHMATLLSSSTKRSRLVGQIVDAVVARGADGVNLDFEPVATSQRANYVTFVKELKAALKAAGGGQYLTVCVMASAATWATGYDVPDLTGSGAANALFVMGYDYNWSGSSRAGGVAPIESPYTIDVDGTMLDFLAETKGSKLIWGVPYYGRTWPTTSGAVNAQTTGSGSKAYYYTGSLAQATQYGRRWDDVGLVPWYRWQDGSGNWTEGYYDDVESLGIKYDLVNARGLAGTGMWTLGMDQGHDELWRLLADKFVNDTAPPVGGITPLPETVDGEAVDVAWRAVDYASGVADYDVQVRQDGGAWTDWLVGTTATSAWFTGVSGSSYEFRVRATDWKGNVQEWTSAPDTPSTVSPDAFARVVTATLNVRSGPGTSYGIVTAAAEGDLVYVLEGPTSANGYDWYRVQYAFSEWPSADYPRVGWMAVGSGSTPYLAPAQAPSRTTLDGFVSDHSATAVFSPNGDGRHDTADVSYTLAGAADDVTLEVVDAGGSVVRSLSLGAQVAGAHAATWDGRLAGGGWATGGSYLLRVAASASDVTHYGPAATVSSAVLGGFGTVADRKPPKVASSSPSSGELAGAGTRLHIIFTEPVKHAGHAHVQLRLAGGTTVPAHNLLRSGGTELVVKPDAKLPVASTVEVWVGSGVRDLVGNEMAPATWSFATAQGTGYRPPRRAKLSGPQAGYVLDASGAVVRAREATLAGVTPAKVDHRGKLPNMPGRWLHLTTGDLAGTWVRESPSAYLPGQVESRALGKRVTVRAGSHIGYLFGADGSVTGTRAGTVSSTSRANVDRRATINGRVYLHVVNGIWAGTWLAESADAYVAGKVTALGLSAAPHVRFAAGTYAGYRFSRSGAVTAKLTAALPGASGANADRWAVINGVPYFRIANGIWAGYWVAEGSGLTFDP